VGAAGVAVMLFILDLFPGGNLTSGKHSRQEASLASAETAGIASAQLIGLLTRTHQGIWLLPTKVKGVSALLIMVKMQHGDVSPDHRHSLLQSI
jgi:hypothetical protein